ncbi:MAG: hypothetical protein GF330_02050 [Candidatus Eisenbacteria bacterium]|nr:hypothetical protein [Candidatus Eisenbacteria bacterium]
MKRVHGEERPLRQVLAARMQRAAPTLLALLGLSLSLAGSGAQAGSIFARDGVGEWIEGYDGAAQARGGTALAVAEAYNAFGPNAATAALSKNAAGHVGLTLSTRWSTDGVETSRRGTSSFTGMGAYVPIGGGFGLRGMLRPVSDGAYAIEQRLETGSGSSGNRRREEGSRGLLQYGGDLVWQVRPRLALAAGVGLISGSLLEETTYSLADSGWSGASVRNELRIEPAVFLTGGLFAEPISRLALGAFVQTPAQGDARTNYRAPEGASWKQDHQIEFPLAAGGGVSLRIGSRLRLSSDLIWRDWEGAEIGAPDQSGRADLRSTLRWGVGIERTARIERRVDPWRRLALRAGFAWVPWYLRDGSGDAIDEWRASAGIGLPIQVDRGMIDLAFVWGQRGDESTNGLSERYYRLSLSFTFARVLRQY